MLRGKSRARNIARLVGSSRVGSALIYQSRSRTRRESVVLILLKPTGYFDHAWIFTQLRVAALGAALSEVLLTRGLRWLAPHMSAGCGAWSVRVVGQGGPPGRRGPLRPPSDQVGRCLRAAAGRRDRAHGYVAHRPLLAKSVFVLKPWHQELAGAAVRLARATLSACVDPR